MAGRAAASRANRERHRHGTLDRLYVYRQPRSRFYGAETFLDGRKRRASLKTDSLTTALKLSEEWYRKELRASVEHARQHPIARLTSDPIIGEVVPQYFKGLSGSKLTYAQWRWSPIQHYWRTIKVRDVKPATFKEFYQWRRRTAKGSMKAHTLHKDIVLIRQVLKHCVEEEYLDRLPLIPKPGKIVPSPRPWLTESEWTHLCAVSENRIRGAQGNPRLQQQRQDTDHFMRFMVASCARVDELRGLRFSDCRYRFPEDDPKPAKGKASAAPPLRKAEPAAPWLLVCHVTGKRGSRDLVTEPEAAEIVAVRRLERKGNDALVFPAHHRDSFRELLIAAGLRTDAQGNARNFKSLRATAISRLVLAGKDLMFIARNAGTSVNMIDLYYARRLTAELAVRHSHPREVAVND